MVKTEYLAELFKTDSKGKTRHWRIWVDGNLIKTEHGVKDGKMAYAEKIAKSKNVGKSNETTPEEQALSQAQSIITEKLEKGYVENIDNYVELVLPMLAHKYTERKKDIKFPCYGQPKIDGIRCFARLVETITPPSRVIEYKVKLTSREDKEFPQPFESLKEEIQEYFIGNEILDGELYIDGYFEDLTHICKTEEYLEKSELFKFNIFDIIVDKEKTFFKRFNDDMIPLCLKDSNTVSIVETIIINSEEEVMEYYDRCIKNGYEGIMLRNYDGKYMYGPSRSKDLQKYKEFIDEEFDIVGAEEAEGNDIGTVVWICHSPIGNKNGKTTFTVRPEGSRAKRKEWWENRDQYINKKKLTVKYQNLTKYNFPRFPVGIAIRDYE